MPNYNVKINFNDGVANYDFPLVQSAEAPKEGAKDTFIDGTRGNGSIRIPGGKQSQIITVRGLLVDEGLQHKDIVTAMNAMNTAISTSTAVLKKTHLDGTTITDFSYTVCRIGEIQYPASLQVYKQEYIIKFKVLAY